MITYFLYFYIFIFLYFYIFMFLYFKSVLKSILKSIKKYIYYMKRNFFFLFPFLNIYITDA